MYEVWIKSFGVETFWHWQSLLSACCVNYNQWYKSGSDVLSSVLSDLESSRVLFSHNFHESKPAPTHTNSQIIHKGVALRLRLAKASVAREPGRHKFQHYNSLTLALSVNSPLTRSIPLRRTWWPETKRASLLHPLWVSLMSPCCGCIIGGVKLNDFTRKQTNLPLPN